MAKCDLELELNKREFFPGETVEATLWLTGNTNFTCKEITIDLIRRAHGRGNTSSKQIERISVYKGDIQDGEKLELNCQFTLPEAPLTYHGQYLNVDWIVKANVDVAWAFDPKCEVDLVLLSNPNALRPQPMEDIKVFGDKDTKASLFGLGCMGCIALIPLGTFVASLVWLLSGEVTAVFGLGVSAFILLIMSVIGFFIIRNRIAMQAVGPVELRLDQDAYYPGQTITGMISFTPQKKLKLNGVNVTIQCKEVVVRGSGTNKTTYTKNLVDQKVVVQSATDAYPKEALEIPFEFTLPDSPWYSFSAPSNTLTWTVNGHIDIDRWPDFDNHWTFTVRG